ncbi:MAG: hypothetical protein ACOYXT_07055 [Bacteroidota bacterium]
MTKIFPALLIACLAYTTMAQTSIPFHGFNSGGERSVGTTVILSGGLGQPIAHSEEGVTLKSGLLAGSLFFLTGNLPPEITFDSTLFTLLNKESKELKVTIIDRDGLATKEFHYRPIANSSFLVAPMTAVNGVQDQYKVTIDPSWIDDMGMEYFITAKDGTDKTSRYPGGSTYMHGFAAITSVSLPSTAYKVYNSGDQKSHYRMIAIPYNLTGHANISEQFNEVENYSKAKYRLATYDNATGNWLEFPDNLGEFKRGLGYWFLTREAVNFTFTDVKTPEEFRSKLFEITLKPGWNQVGNPYPEPINWEDVRAYNNDAAINAIKIYTDGAYNDGNLLNPFEGGFVKLQGTSSKTIKIPFQGQTSGGRKHSHEFSGDLASEKWMVRLKLDDGVMSTSIAAIGMHPQASADEDRFDDFYPPRFLDYAEVKFTNPENSIEGLAKDFVPSQGKYMWDFTIEATAPVLNLQWDNAEMGNNAIDLLLYDVANARLINMREVNECVVLNGSHYKIYYGEHIVADIKPDRTVAGKPFPNPWSGQSDVSIPFGLPMSQHRFDVRVQILDARGNIVRELVNDRLPSGFYETRWNGADGHGEICSSGLYFYRLSIAQGDHKQNFSERILLTK